HVTICRAQATHDAVDQFGRLVRSPLRPGSWKTHPNQVIRQDGTALLFCPPEQVDTEIARLVELYRGSDGLHPLIRAAWLHHAFVSIHPFDDGNGRVARALSLLVLLRNRYAPLVVDRYSRTDYINALETATDGDLRPLVRLFARLEVVALRAELERPALPPTAGAGAIDVANAHVARLRALRGENTADERATGVRAFAGELLPRVSDYLRDVGKGLDDAFRNLDPNTYHAVDAAEPGDERGGWWRAQIIRTAREADFYTNITGGTWWASLRLTVLGQKLRYVAVLQKVGHGETGVLALTIFAEAVTDTLPQDPSSAHAAFIPLLKTSDAESVTFVHTDDVHQRWDEVRGTIDRTLAATVSAFASGLT
ncbi:MAG: hypothetical protein QG622_76, partial [Actinomycetota bacterium]|nr:hypothetical protein [Actinomycetota bacterium]